MGCKNSKVATKPQQQQQTRERSDTLTQEINVPENKQDDEVKPKSKLIQVSNEHNENNEDLETYYVREALAILLPNYNVDTVTDNTTDQDIPETRIGVMQVRRNIEIKITPNPNGKYLAYGKPETKYTLHLATKKDDSSQVKFLYQWERGTDEYVTSPFFDQDPQAGKRVKCDTQSITEAILEEHPIQAIVEVLMMIVSDRKGENIGLDGPDFLWLKNGSDESFSVTIPDKTMTWKDINDNKVGKQPKPPVKVTKNENKKLLLLFRDT